MDSKISHDWELESPEAKTRWFRSLSISERGDYLCEMTDLILEINPRIMEKNNAQPIDGRIRILTQAQD